MNLSGRLENLVSHEILVATSIAGEERDVPGGILAEVGEDYILVKTEDEEKGGFAITGAQWFVRLAAVMHIIHMADCKKCAVEEVAG